MSDKIPIPRKLAAGLADPSATLSSSPDWARSSLGCSSERDDAFVRRDSDFRINGVPCNPTHANATLTEDFSVKFFQPLLVADPCTRKAALDNICEFLLKPENEKLLRAHIPVIVRLSTETPFPDITETFQRLIEIVSRTRHSISIPEPSKGPSSFITDSLAPPLNTPNDNISRLFQELFLQIGRVSHLNRLLATHQEYFERYYLTFNRIMREPGPLPFHWRNYLAILAASRLSCQYLVSIQEQEYILNNGDPRWLQGVTFAPRKIQNILQVVALLAHQPWLLTKDHIEPLVKGTDAWSISELVHALVLTCTFISLSGFVFGCGITPEIDIPEQQLSRTCPESIQAADTSTVSADTAKVIEKLKIESNASDMEDVYEDERENDFANAGDGCVDSNGLGSGSEVPVEETADLSRYTGGITLTHTDFDVKAKNYVVFRVQEYSWKDHGYELIRRFYPDTADPLDEEFDYTYTMTDNTFHTNVNVNTLPFRSAIWYYVQRVKGMMHDDYKYQQVNTFLNQSIKSFVKKLVCTPYTITQSDYSNLGLELRPEEKAHIALLALESNKQATLLYGLHAVMMYMNRFTAD